MTQTGTSSRSSLSRPATLVAVSAVIVWLAFSIYLLAQARSSSELQWTRIAWVFGSVEAVAFAAAGALFGTAVQRDRAEQAETRAQTAEQAAGQNLQDATKGRALAAAIQADAGAGAKNGPLQAMGPGQTPAGDETLRRYAQLARSLFGDLAPPS
jgi:TRAP-type uncharacterized transport system substrate-binding protein